MIRERWDARAAAIDQQVRERLAAEGVRKLEDRNRDTLRIIDAVRHEVRSSVARPEYRMTEAEFAALIRTEMLIEDRDTSKGGSGETTEEFKERVGRLPVYGSGAAAARRGHGRQFGGDHGVQGAS